MTAQRASGVIDVTHPNLLRVGWLTFWVGALIHLSMALLAAYSYWQGRCYDGIHFTFAPLVYSCGEPTATDITFGWIATALTLFGPLLALACGIVSAFVANSSPLHTPLIRSIWLSATALTAIGAGWLTWAWLEGSAVWGPTTWIMYTAFSTIAVLMASGVGYLILLGVTAAMSPSDRLPDAGQ
jgi:hypothetical protein